MYFNICIFWKIYYNTNLDIPEATCIYETFSSLEVQKRPVNTVSTPILVERENRSHLRSDLKIVK